MRTTHKVALSVDRGIQGELAKLGIEVELGFQVFRLDDNDPNWAILEPELRKREAAIESTSKYTQREISEARWCRLVASWHYGYPQPEEGVPDYLDLTFEAAENCRTCGIVGDQKAPFSIGRYSSWGRRNIGQLNWIFDAFFVTPELFDQAFSPLGVLSRDVLDYSTRSVLPGIRQLHVDGDVSVDTSALCGAECVDCGRVKYLPVSHGWFPPVASGSMRPLVRTREVFGSGSNAHHAILVSSELREALQSAGMSGASFIPLSSGG